MHKVRCTIAISFRSLEINLNCAVNWKNGLEVQFIVPALTFYSTKIYK